MIRDRRQKIKMARTKQHIMRHKTVLCESDQRRCIDGTGEQTDRRNNKTSQRGGEHCRHSQRRTAGGNGSITKARWRCNCVARSCASMCARRLAKPRILAFRAWARAAIRLLEKAPYFASKSTRLLNALMLYVSDTELHDDKDTHYSSSNALMSACVCARICLRSLATSLLTLLNRD